VYGLQSHRKQGNLVQLHGFESNLVTSVYSTNEIFVHLYDHDNCIPRNLDTFYDFVSENNAECTVICQANENLISSDEERSCSLFLGRFGSLHPECF
jgi:hypothetical protein